MNMKFTIACAFVQIFVLFLGVSVVGEIIPNFRGPQPIFFDGSIAGQPSEPTVGEIIDRTTIDPYTFDTSPPVIVLLSSGAPPQVTESTSDQDSSIIGGERDIILTAEEGQGGLVFTAGAAGGTFSISTPNQGSGIVVLQYDGLDGSPELDTAVGLGGIDLTDGSAVGFRINALSDVTTQFTLTIYDSNGNSVSSESQVNGGGQTQSYELFFADFQGQIDFSSVNAVEFQIEAFDNVDFNLETFVTFSNIVEPPPVSDCFSNATSPCLTNYYRIEELVDITPGDYITFDFNYTATPDSPDSTASFYLISSNFEDLELTLQENTDIVSTLGGLPGPTFYDYKCEEDCKIEIVWSALQNTTYYIAIEGEGPGPITYNVCISRSSVPIVPIFGSEPWVVEGQQRSTTPPDDNVRHYAYYSLEIPVERFSEGTYFTASLFDTQPLGDHTLRIMYEGLPEAPEDTGRLGTIDVSSSGNRVDDSIYSSCVETSRTGYRRPISSEPRIPCECSTSLVDSSCTLVVDPCNFRYGTWYFSVELPERTFPSDETDTSGALSFVLEANVIQPPVREIKQNNTLYGSILPEFFSHFKIDVPLQETSPSRSHLVVYVSNIRGGTVDIFVHEGRENNRLAGPEGCSPANATCRSCDACNVVVEKCHFSSGPWYVSVGAAFDEESGEFLVDGERPISFTIRTDWVVDNPPMVLRSGVPATRFIGEALYDFFVLNVPATVDTMLYIELFVKANDTEVALAVLHDDLPGGECYARPDFFCLTGDPRGIRSSNGPTSFIDNEAIQRESCNFMIQACELTAGPLYFSVYGHHTGYTPYGDTTFYQNPVEYTLYAEFDTPMVLTSGISYSEVVFQDSYQHYYLRVDRPLEGQWVSFEITNIQHGIPQALEGYVNYNFLAGDCPCYDSMFTCTQDSQCAPEDALRDPFALPDIESVNTCCTILVNPSDLRDGVWYFSVRGVNEDQFQYTTPIGYTLTATLHNAPVFTPLPVGQLTPGVAPQWNRTHEYAHFRLLASPIPLNDLVIKLTWVQTCDSWRDQGHLQNMWESLSLYVNYDRTAGKHSSGNVYSCSASDLDQSYCTVVIPHCQWMDRPIFLAVRGDYEAPNFDARFTVQASLSETRDVALSDNVPYYDRVGAGLYSHYYIYTEAEEDRDLWIDVYTNQDQDPVTVYLNKDQRAGEMPCFRHEMSCVTQSCCSWQLQSCDLSTGRYYISVQAMEHPFYDLSTEFTILAKHMKVSNPLLNGLPVTGHLSRPGQISHFSYKVDQITPGDALVFSVDNVKHGSVYAFAQFGSLAGRCPCYTWEMSCAASSDGKNWCSLRIPPCDVKVGTYFFSVYAEEQLTPEPPIFYTPIGFTVELKVIVPTFTSIEADVGRQLEDSKFEKLGVDRYRHYAFSWDDDDFDNGYHLIVEISNVRNGELDVFYNSFTPADESCNMAQICDSTIVPGADCYWQLPYCLTRPLDDPINHYITVYNGNLGARQFAEYDILIWKQPVPAVYDNPSFTLDDPINFSGFPSGVEFNVTHSVFNEPNGWTQFIRLPDVDLTEDRFGYGEVLELFFYRITNNFAQPMAFNVYVHPLEPAGAHTCCNDNPGSCQGAPCSNSADTTTQVDGIQHISHTCDLGNGIGTADVGNPFFGEQCVVRVWPCEFRKYCPDTTHDWYLSVVPIAPTSYFSEGPGLQYSFQWRWRNLRFEDENRRDVGSVDLTPAINTYEFTNAFEVIASPFSEIEGWRNFRVNFTLPNARLSIQTRFIAGEGTVYINRDTFAAPGYCYDYECSTISDESCEEGGRFITSECCSDIPEEGFSITVRNTGSSGSALLVAFRIVVVQLPEPVFIDDHPSLESPFIANSGSFQPLFVNTTLFSNFTGVENENYQRYALTIDDDDLDQEQSWIVSVERTDDNESASLHAFLRFGAPPGNYGPSVLQNEFGTADEGCHGWQYLCIMNTPESSCFWQIPHCDLIEGFWYISLFNPQANLEGLPSNLPSYNLTTYISPPPTELTLNEPFAVSSLNSNFIPGQLMHFKVNVSANIGGFDDRDDLESYWNRFLRFQINNVSASDDIQMWVNYDFLAGPDQESSCLSNLDSRDCLSGLGCYYDVLPCSDDEDDFKLKTGVYYISVRMNVESDFDLLVQMLTEEYTFVEPSEVVEGLSQRIGTTNVIWRFSGGSGSGANATAGDEQGSYRYVIDMENGETDDDDMVDNQYVIINITAPETGIALNETLHLEVWRDDCTRFTCDIDGPLSWCTIDALTLGPCALKGGRFYFRVENPLELPFNVDVYLNETILVPIQDRQVITEFIYPYEYQEYFYNSFDVGDGATLTARVCSICGDVEAWIRPDFPAGPTPDVTGEASSCSVDYCRTDNETQTAFGDFPQNCCDIFLDTCEYDQRGYYVGIRGVSAFYPNERNPNIYLPVQYSIEVFQTTVNFTDISFADCDQVVEYSEPWKDVPRQYAIDIETLTVGSSVRVTLHVMNGSETNEMPSMVSLSMNRSLGYSEQCDYDMELSCSTVDSCSFIVPYCKLAPHGAQRLYIWADAPRGSVILVERDDSVAPLIWNDVRYESTINGMNYMDYPYQPNAQIYRFDVSPPEMNEKFFLRVVIDSLSHGSVAAAVNSGQYPYMMDSGCQMPVFNDSVSCSSVGENQECWIDVQWSDVMPMNEFLNAPTTFWLTVYGLEQDCELHSISYSFVVQTNFVVTYFPIGETVCDEVDGMDYNFHRLSSSVGPSQQSYLQFTLSDLQEGESVDLLINEGRLATRDSSSIVISSSDEEEYIMQNYFCGYERLYVSVYGESPSSDYKLHIAEIPVPVKELFDNSTYHADDDDDDACPHEHDFYRFAINEATPEGSFFRVAVDSEYPTEVYVNRGSFAWSNCHNAASGSNDPRESGTTTVNVYDFCDYFDDNYYVTVVSKGPYYIYTDIRDDPKELTLGQVFRDELEPGMYQMYTLEICEEWFEADDRLVVEITDVENGDVFAWIRREANPGEYTHDDGSGDCSIDTAFADYGPAESGYDFLLVNSCELTAGTYRILVRASPHEGSPERNCQHVFFRLYPYLIDYQIEPQAIEPNSVIHDAVDFYTINRIDERSVQFINYYRVTPLMDEDGFVEQISHMVARLAKVSGGLLKLRVMCGHLALAEYGYFDGEIYGLSKDSLLNPDWKMQSGRRPFTYQRMLDDRQSVYQPECDGCTDFCCEMTYDDMDEYKKDKSCAVWIPACYLVNADMYLAVEPVMQYSQDHRIIYDLAITQSQGFALLEPNTQFESQFSNDNWDYNFLYSVTDVPESMRWRVRVTQGEGVLLTVRNHRCPLQATWSKQIWCDAAYFDRPWLCDVEVATPAEHPKGRNTFFISVYGKNATYSLASWVGRENCHAFVGSGRNEGLDFCAGLVPYAAWRWDSYVNLDNEAHCFFNELYEHFQVQPCWTGVSAECNATLQAFACFESFHRCDEHGFLVPTCREACSAVTSECFNSFDAVDLEYYNCSSSRYGDANANTCTITDSLLSEVTEARILMENPILLDFSPSPDSLLESSSASNFTITALFILFVVFMI